MRTYRDMTRLACYIAQANMQDWRRHDIEDMVEFCGVDACIDFYKHYQHRYGIDCSKILEWLDEIQWRDEHGI